MRKHLILFWISIQTGAIAQNPAKEYADQIIQSELKENLSILASDALEGRETGTRGQKMAAAFISYQFAEAGLKPPVNGSYYQTFNLYRTVQAEVYLSTRGTRFKNFQD